MENLPKNGSRVMVWPRPGLVVQATAVAISDGGMVLPKGGREIIWTDYSYRQLLHGEILLTDPTKEYRHAKTIADPELPELPPEAIGDASGEWNVPVSEHKE